MPNDAPAPPTTPATTRLVFRVVVEGPWDAMTDPAEWVRYFQTIAWNNLGSRDEFRVGAERVPADPREEVARVR